MNEDHAATMTDSRSYLRRSWERYTYYPVIGKSDHFIGSGIARLSILDRVMVLFGRDILIVVTTDSEPDFGHAPTYELIDTLTIEVCTQPTRYR